MRFRWAAFAAVLTLALTPQLGSAQGSTQGTSKRPAVALGQNFPNPFNPETRIPFTVGDFPTCADGGRQYKVSLRVYNLLAQLAAVPVLQGGTGNVAGGQQLEHVLLTCGQYTAYWNGMYRNTANEVASGIYMYALEVDGQRVVKKMIVMK